MPQALRPTPLLRRLAAGALALAAALLPGCGPRHGDGRVHIVYWEKWNGSEAEAMQQVVDAFNRSQDRIFVEFLAVSGIERKTILASAGGDPPDVAGIWVQQIPSWADRGALTPIDELMRESGTDPDEFMGHYERVYADMCRYDGHVYSLPATPAMIALHWNKTAFREAGLDPERPPRTLEELREFSRRLTRRDARTGALTQIGFLPQDPGWWPWSFPRWFGGELISADGRITAATDPANIEAFTWVRGFTEDYGLEELKVFATGFGQFGSPQYPFFQGKIAIVLQGVWFNNYINQYAPGLDYGVAPWPVVHEGEAPYSIGEADMLVIPAGARHPREAWEFIKYVSSPNLGARSRGELSGLELLCYLQEKNSPLKAWSPYFAEAHRHPFIGVFRELSRSPRADFTPKMGIWQEYSREMNIAFDRVRLLQQTPHEALAYVQARIEASWAEHSRSLERQRRAERR
ncbi:MAG: ABC transporter substrate-binding protein [Opitutaceae bacterium]|nr:ABC transporter substrate-binding protein [Opitutaceae bacterium]